MCKALGLAQHRADLAPIVAAEVAAHSLAQVGGLAHVEHLVVGAEEAIDAGRPGQLVRELQLAGLRMAAHLGQQHQIVEAQHAEAGGALEQQVQQVGGGERVVERAVVGPMIEPKATGQRAQAAIRHLVAHQPTSEWQRVDDGVAKGGPVAAEQRGVDEPHVETDVVADDDRVADELLQGGQHRLDARCLGHHRLRDAREHGDAGGDGLARVDQGGHGAQTLAVANLDDPDLGDEVATAVAAGGLDVEHAERDIGQWGSEVVERSLHDAQVEHERPFGVKNMRSTRRCDRCG